MAALEVAGDVFVEPAKDDLVRASTKWILAELHRVLSEQDRCSIALSGGTTPGPIYRNLAEAGAMGYYDGSRLDLCLADERCVPFDHPDSNARLVREQWLVVDSRPRLIRPRAEAKDWAAEADAYAKLLPDPIDLVVLGIGPDGHTASLFPTADALREPDRAVVYVSDSPKPPAQRWSLSPLALGKAGALVTIVSGTDKAPALVRALEGPWDPQATPAQLARRGTWFVDAAAASLLNL